MKRKSLLKRILSITVKQILQFLGFLSTSAVVGFLCLVVFLTIVALMSQLYDWLIMFGDSIVINVIFIIIFFGIGMKIVYYMFTEKKEV